jgi:hypothetical protein
MQALFKGAFGIKDTEAGEQGAPAFSLFTLLSLTPALRSERVPPSMLSIAVDAASVSRRLRDRPSHESQDS